MHQLLLLLLATGALSAARAQTPAPPPAAAARWHVGVKLGTGAAHYLGEIADQPHPWTAYTGGLSAGYAFAAAGGFLNLQADALLERRPARPWQTAVGNPVLFVPLYLRTDPAAARVHFLVGGGPTFWLAGSAVPDAQAGLYATHPVEATALAGLEVRLLPLGRFETTLALTYRRSMTPALIRYRRSPGGHAYEDVQVPYWLGTTLNVYLHTAARP